MFCRLAICLSIGMVLLLPWPMKAQEDPLHLVIEEQLSSFFGRFGARGEGAIASF